MSFDQGMNNLNFLGNFVAKELWKKPLPGKLDPVFSKLIHPEYSKAYHNNGKLFCEKVVQKQPKKRKSEEMESFRVDAPHQNSSSSKKLAKESSEKDEEILFMYESGYEVFMAAADNLLSAWDTIMTDFGSSLSAHKTLTKVVLIQLRDAVLAYCWEKGAEECIFSSEVFSTVLPIFQYSLILSPIGKKISDLCDFALSNGMEMELLFLLHWSVLHTTEKGHKAKIHDSVLHAWRDKLSAVPQVKESTRLVHIVKERSNILVAILDAYLGYMEEQSMVEVSAEETLTEILFYSYFSGYNPDSTREISLVTRGEILCRISSQWIPYKSKWESILSAKRPVQPMAATSSWKKKTSVSTELPIKDNVEPKSLSSDTMICPNINSAKKQLTTKSAADIDIDQLCERKLAVMTLYCPQCPPASKALSWHRFMEHVRYFHIDGDPTSFNDLLSNAFMNDSECCQFVTMGRPVISPGIFVHCRDCRVLCCGRFGLLRHREQCQQAIPLTIQYGHLFSNDLFTVDSLKDFESAEIEWFFALIQTYVLNKVASDVEQDILVGRSKQQEVCDRLRKSYIEVFALLRDISIANTLSNAFLQSLQHLNNSVPVDAVYLRGQVYDSARHLCRYYLKSFHQEYQSRLQHDSDSSEVLLSEPYTFFMTTLKVLFDKRPRLQLPRSFGSVLVAPIGDRLALVSSSTSPKYARAEIIMKQKKLVTSSNTIITATQEKQKAEENEVIMPAFGVFSDGFEAAAAMDEDDGDLEFDGGVLFQPVRDLPACSKLDEAIIPLKSVTKDKKSTGARSFSVHNNQNAGIQCPSCPKRLSNMNSFRSHVIKLHKGADPQLFSAFCRPGNHPCACPSCKVVFFSRQLLNRHVCNRATDNSNNMLTESSSAMDICSTNDSDGIEEDTTTGTAISLSADLKPEKNDGEEHNNEEEEEQDLDSHLAEPFVSTTIDDFFLSV